MTGRDPSGHSLILPVRSRFGKDDELERNLARNFAHIEEWTRVPHRSFGSRMISPQFFAIDEDDHAFSAQPLANAFAGPGTDMFPGVTIEVDRPMRAFVVGIGVWDNTDAATAYSALFFLPVELSAGVTAGTNNGTHTNQFRGAGATGRATLVNIRHAWLNFVPTDDEYRATATFYWGWKQTDAAAQDMTVYRQKMIVAVYDAPDVGDAGDVVWTRSAVTRDAYRAGEADE